MKKKKLTNKERDEIISMLWKEIVEIKQIFSLYLEYKKETEKYNKFVKAKAEEFEKQQRSEDKKGA